LVFYPMEKIGKSENNSPPTALFINGERKKKKGMEYEKGRQIKEKPREGVSLSNDLYQETMPPPFFHTLGMGKISKDSRKTTHIREGANREIKPKDRQEKVQ